MFGEAVLRPSLAAPRGNGR